MKVTLFCPGLGFIQRGFETLTREVYYAVKKSSKLTVTLFQGDGEQCEGATQIWAPRRNSFFWELPLLRNFRYRKYLSYQLECLVFTIPLIWHCFRKKPELIYFSDSSPAEILMKLRKLISPKTKFLYCNGAPAPPEVYKRYDFVQVMTPKHHQEALTAGMPEDRLFLVPQGLNCEMFQVEQSEQLRERFKLPREKFVILSVGAITASHKRMDWIIEEFSKLDSEWFHLWIVGQKELGTDQIEQLAREKLPSNNYTFETLPYDSMPLVYAASDIFTLASLNEGFGRVYVEAMASALPVIAHDTPNTRWILGESNPGLCDMTEPEALSQKIKQLTTNPEQAKQLADTNRQRAFEQFDWERIRPQYEEMFLSCSTD